jgi:hypothetical protein
MCERGKNNGKEGGDYQFNNSFYKYKIYNRKFNGMYSDN